jgi:hypothetical protein
MECLPGTLGRHACRFFNRMRRYRNQTAVCAVSYGFGVLAGDIALELGSRTASTT